METLIHDILFIGQGLGLTLALLFGGLLIGALVGGSLSILQHHKIACFIISCYVSLLRGTPLLLQLSLIYFAVPSLFGIKLNVFAAGIIAFGINSSAYITEILRAGIESIPKGQFEAARSLGIPPYAMWKDIIFPQVIRNIFPSLVNEVIALLKETALIGTISGMDITRAAQALGAQQFTYFLPLCIAAAYYYCLVLIIERCGKMIEQRGWYVKR